MHKNRVRSFLTKIGCVALSFMMITLLAGPLSVKAAEDIQPDASVQDLEGEDTVSIVVSEAENTVSVAALDAAEGETEDVASTSGEETVTGQNTNTEPTTDIESGENTDPDPADTPVAEPKNGVVIEDGIYHYYINDVMQKWLITTETGDRYYAGSDGVLVRNTVISFSDSKIGWLYFGNDGKAKKWLITAKNGDRYYAGSDGKLVRNEVIRFANTKIGWLYFGDDGRAQKWLITTKNGDRYYAGSDGKLVRNQVIKFSNAKIGWLYFGNDGKAQKWLITTKNGDRYYAGSDGKLARNEVIRFANTKIGWLYFGDDGKAKKWLITAKNGDRYYAGSDGKLVRNEVIRFANTKIGWLYFENDGKAAKGKIVSIDGKSYYATRGDGSIMRTSGRIFLNGKMYYAQNGGVLLKNAWKKIGDKWYHFNASGVNDKTQTSAPLDAMGEKAQKYSSNTEYLILVDRDEHRVSIYTGETWNWRQVKTFSCGNGKASTPTITGQFSIPSKYPRSHPYFDSGSARCWYPTRIYGGYLFHSVLYYQQSGPYSIMDGRLGVGVSHGCIRLALDNAKWIYYNIPIGTKVVIY